MQGTNWPAFGIGMAAGVALSVSLYFGWSLIRPAPREADNAVIANAPMPVDENALVAANAERPDNNVRPPAQLQPEAEPVAEPVREPPVVRPEPRRLEPYDPPPEDDPPPEEDPEKPVE